MKTCILFAVCLSAIPVAAQEVPSGAGAEALSDGRSLNQTDPASLDDSAKTQSAPAVEDPFKLIDQGMGMMGGDMMGEMEMGADDGMEGMGEMGGMMGMGGGMGGMGGGMGGYYDPNDADGRFQQGLGLAIKALREAKSSEETDLLMKYVRSAFEKRYDQTIETRRDELLKIKQRVAKLEADLQRREKAKQRVIEVQLQSVQLAAEGLMEINP